MVWLYFWPVLRLLTSGKISVWNWTHLHKVHIRKIVTFSFQCFIMSKHLYTTGRNDTPCEIISHLTQNVAYETSVWWSNVFILRTDVHSLHLRKITSKNTKQLLLKSNDDSKLGFRCNSNVFLYNVYCGVSDFIWLVSLSWSRLPNRRRSYVWWAKGKWVINVQPLNQ